MTINTANINKLITFLSTHPTNFNMRDWNTGVPGAISYPEPDCNTVMCIGGAACYLRNLEENNDGNEWSSVRAKEWLGLDDYEGNRLFYPPIDIERQFSTITLADALETLTILRDEGRVTWAHIRHE